MAQDDSGMSSASGSAAGDEGPIAVMVRLELDLLEAHTSDPNTQLALNWAARLDHEAAQAHDSGFLRADLQMLAALARHLEEALMALQVPYIYLRGPVLPERLQRVMRERTAATDALVRRGRPAVARRRRSNGVGAVELATAERLPRGWRGW